MTLFVYGIESCGGSGGGRVEGQERDDNGYIARGFRRDSRKIHYVVLRGFRSNEVPRPLILNMYLIMNSKCKSRKVTESFGKSLASFSQAPKEVTLRRSVLRRSIPGIR